MDTVRADWFEARYNACKRMAEQVNKYIANPKYIVMYDGGQLHVPLVIDDERKDILIQASPTCRIIIFLGDPELDNGAYTTVKDHKREFDAMFQVTKIVKNKWSLR